VQSTVLSMHYRYLMFYSTLTLAISYKLEVLLDRVNTASIT